jgi:ribonuclease HI
MTQIISFTDGASSGNPGPAGWGAVISVTEQPDRGSDGALPEVKEIGGPIKEGTNNEAELTAAINVLRFAESNSVDTVTIYTDSSYLIDGATSWVYGWQKNGWQTRSGDPVKNQDLWQQILTLQQSLSVSYEKVAGHAGVPANERADDIATDFAAREEPSLYAGKKVQYDTSLQAQVAQIPNGPVYLSLVDGVAKQHSSWQDCKQRVDGVDAQYRKAKTKQERQDVLSGWGKNTEDVTD